MRASCFTSLRVMQYNKCGDVTRRASRVQDASADGTPRSTAMDRPVVAAVESTRIFIRRCRPAATCAGCPTKQSVPSEQKLRKKWTRGVNSPCATSCRAGFVGEVAPAGVTSTSWDVHRTLACPRVLGNHQRGESDSRTTTGRKWRARL